MVGGKLSVVATPIGNLEDITLRAIRVLKEAHYILAEDTRVTGKLLKHYEIDTKLKRYDAHASERVHEEIISDLSEGKHIALVSDAGTPGVSDPGVLLVSRVRDEVPDATIETIPGPSALTAAFSIAGIHGNQFVFLGYAPQKKGRQTFFKEITKCRLPIIFFESTHRIMKTLTELSKFAKGSESESNEKDTNTPIDWSITVARELTKLHEEVVRGSVEAVLAYFEDHPDHQKGEFVILVDPK